MSEQNKQQRRDRIDSIRKKMIEEQKNELALLGALGKIPPQAIDLEQTVIGAVLLEKNDDTEQVLTVDLSPNDFYLNAHAEVWKAAQALYKRREPIDILTVTHELRKMGVLEQVGGPLFVSQLTNRVSSSANIQTHAKIVRQKSMLRSLIQMSGTLARKAYDETEDVFDLIDEAHKMLSDATEIKSLKPATNMHDATMQVINNLSITPGADGLTGIHTGLHTMNSYTSGWRRGDMIVIGARPSMGKTAHMCSCAVNTAKAGIPVGVFSLEMPTMQIGERLISAKERQPLEMFKSANMRQDALTYVKTKFQTFANLPIYIDDTAALSVYEFRSKARRLVKDYGVQIIYIDYIQLMTVSGTGADGKSRSKSGNREQEIGEISRMIKQIAKELDIPIVVYAQVGRAVEQRSNKIPLLSDLRESGAIEQDADVVGYLYRPEYYGIETDDSGNSTRNAAYIVIAKYRNGAINLEGIKHIFVGKYGLWLDENEGHAMVSSPDFINTAMYKPNTNFTSAGPQPAAEPALGDDTPF
jgi:replicative DNA helicase